jgi:hypothetical protein
VRSFCKRQLERKGRARLTMLAVTATPSLSVIQHPTVSRFGALLSARHVVALSHAAAIPIARSSHPTTNPLMNHT